MGKTTTPTWELSLALWKVSLLLPLPWRLQPGESGGARTWLASGCGCCWALLGGQAEEGEEEGECGKGGVLRGARGVIYAEQALLPLPLTLLARSLEPEGAQGAS